MTTSRQLARNMGHFVTGGMFHVGEHSGSKGSKSDSINSEIVRRTAEHMSGRICDRQQDDQLTCYHISLRLATFASSKSGQDAYATQTYSPGDLSYAMGAANLRICGIIYDISSG